MNSTSASLDDLILSIKMDKALANYQLDEAPLKAVKDSPTFIKQ
jgi:hypothetical protein